VALLSPWFNIHLLIAVAGEIVCAGAMEPFNIYVWSLQVSQLVVM
jgi:hypothetical protein